MATWRMWIGVFRLALRLYPRRWRSQYAEEAFNAFTEGLERRAGDSGSLAAHRYGVLAVSDALLAGWRERGAGAPDAAVGRATAGGDGLLSTLLADLHYSGRRLRRAPAFTAAVLGILALGVGANAAVFTVLRGAVLAPLPFPEGQRLVLPQWKKARAVQGDTSVINWSYPNFADVRRASDDVFQSVAAYAARSAALTDPGSAESVSFEFVTPAYFDILGVVPVAGRFFHPEEEGAGEPPNLAVISHGLWVQRFGADPNVAGRTLTADGTRLEIVGVAPEGFRGLTGSARFWLPMGQARATLGAWALEWRTSHWHHMLARLRPGVDPASAEERLGALARDLASVEGYLDPGESVVLTVEPLASVWTNPEARTSVWLAMASAILVLVIAVTNLASLLLARGRREVRETAIRLALGAGRARLIGQRVTESLVLALAGGSVGLMLASWAMDGLSSRIPSHLFRGAGGDVLLVETEALAVDPAVALFGLTVAVVAGVVFGTLPALAHGGVDLVPALRKGGGSGGRSTGGRDGRRWLVGGQVALSVILLVGAGLLLGTLVKLHQEQRGFDPEGLLVLRYSLGGRSAEYSGEGAARDFHRTFRDRLAAHPGVRSVALATTPPLSGHFIQTRVRGVVGREPYDPGAGPLIGVHLADGGLFRTLGTRLLQGRTFTSAEFEAQEHVTVVSQRTARELFPGEDPLGREILVGFSVHDEEHPFRIVGVVEDILYSAPTAGVIPEMYIPMGLWAPLSMAAFVRTEGDPGQVVGPARRILASLDPDVPFWQVKTGMELRGEGVVHTRILLILLGVFAGLALMLAAAGLWAVVAEAVTERRREIGLRMALGARGREVEGLVFRQALVPILTGGILGVIVAAAVAPRMAGLLFGVGARSPLIYLGAAGVLVTVALLATWIPARRAARIEPMEALAAD